MSLAVISWNIGEINKQKMEKLNNEVTSILNVKDEPDVLVLGFQELKQSGIYLKTITIKGYTRINKGGFPSLCHTCTCTNIAAAMTGGYTIGMLIFKKEGSPVRVTVKQDKKHTRCLRPNFTKGYLVVNLKINDKEILLINTHAPFKNNGLEESNEFFTKMLEGITHENIILFGDLNSRCLLSKSCYTKDLEDCDKDNLEAPPCKLMTKLETLTLETEKKEFETKKSEDENNIQGNAQAGGTTIDGEVCSSPEFDNLGYTFDENTNSFSKIVDILKKTDSLNYFLKKDRILSRFTEHTINFLPTYKRVEKGKLNGKKKGCNTEPMPNSCGKFELIHKEGNPEGEASKKQRLPGYADRILYTKKFFMKSTIYQPVYIPGNDHLPIMAYFDPIDPIEIKNPQFASAAGGGYKKKVKKTFKKRVKKKKTIKNKIRSKRKLKK